MPSPVPYRDDLSMNGNPTIRPGAMLARIVLASVMMAITVLVGSTAAQAAEADEFFEIRNANTGLCIQPLTNGESLLVQRPCIPTETAQRWAFVPNGFIRQFGVNHIVNRRSGLCMYMDGPVASGSPVIQATCTRVSNENWRNSTPPFVTTIESMAGNNFTKRCITPESLGAGAVLRIFDCYNSNPARRWVIGAQST